MMQPGDVVFYRCRAGADYLAEVIAVRQDGRLDLAVDAGVKDRVELTRIEMVPALRPGTCARETNGKTSRS